MPFAPVAFGTCWSSSPNFASARVLSVVCSGMDDERPTTVREASRLTGVEPRQIYRWVEKGAVPAYQTPGGSLRVKPRDCLPAPRRTFDGDKDTR